MSRAYLRGGFKPPAPRFSDFFLKSKRKKMDVGGLNNFRGGGGGLQNFWGGLRNFLGGGG